MKYRKIPDFTRWILCDKYVTKLYAQQNGFYIPHTYQLVKYPHQIDFNFKNGVIKPVDLCDSGGVYLIKNGKNMKTGQLVNQDKIVRELQKLRSEIRDEYYMHEEMYRGKVPWSGYMVEELLLDSNGKLPYDYKCYVFGGKLYFTALTYDRKMVKEEQTFKSLWLDRYAQPIKYPMIKKGYQYRNFQKPKSYDKMVNLVENMGRKLKRHCRIDVYLIGDKVYLGEFTFFCGAKLHTRLCNLKLGCKWLQNPDDYESQDEELKKLVPNFYNTIY